MNFLPVILIAASVGFGEPHAKTNPVYAELLEKGVTSQLAPTFRYPLPEPTMADGLSAVEQKAAMEQVIGKTYTLPDFLHNSPVAAHITRVGDLEKVGDQPVRKVDVYFVAYGSLNGFSKKEQFGNLLNDTEKDAKGHVLTAAELTERGIPAPDEANRKEAYGYGSSSMFNQVQLGAVAHTYWTTNDDSILAAVKVDPRFINDAKYANSWSALSRNAQGKVEPGQPHPYDGSGTYVKITKLHEPADALFVEIHSAFIEPHDWFEGRGTLASKLALVAQSQVRTFRRELGQTLPKPPQK